MSNRSINRQEPPVVGEALGGQAPQPELLEADPDQLVDRLRGVAVALVVGAQRPAELGLDAAGLVGHLGLRPGVLHQEHQVADHGAVELDHQGSVQMLARHEPLPVVLEIRCETGDPLADRRLAAELPDGVAVALRGRPDRQPFGAHRPADGLETRMHPTIMAGDALFGHQICSGAGALVSRRVRWYDVGT